ncbi:undecaprenol kinase [Prosthecochloris aestuarii DSM 271]|uniref:Undecaprenyl-diphosphatase n=1 Tax=Prosthecochloris aestuarii (strain DSM 271 / SK 413) TaxID=290512 RepID=UPPP_PROA2|nr:undecaprenyl-diphosphatase UppP [Prosthecochloris aestuarii]B4S3H1.1 RecName: Full=Undecaprenyl-diphosphatase; AltName: Full=Bacitracin resistance protein; AltName: Full=Undecaprenyl pyrophosphate phosphatase [Prosthecochloris aestuarii DSM 271]ACF46710.1 undecaprenol kinase [Prosthecochloris aestuarii DSM 271]
MSLFEAIILGIAQGLTEFLPISSTAHLRIVPALAGWQDPGAAFTAIVQIGTLIAVLIYFFRDIVTISGAVIKGLMNASPLGTPDAKMGWMIAAGTIPIVVFGLLFKTEIETSLRSLYWISAALITLAIILSLAEWLIKKRIAKGIEPKSMSDIRWKEALIIGLVQSIALIPGSSRSGVTITGGLFMNLSRETAARFSFLLSLPAVFAAGIYQLYKSWDSLMASTNDLVNLIVATLVAGIVGYASIAFLITFLKQHSTAVFIIYRIALGLTILALIATGNVQA